MFLDVREPWPHPEPWRPKRSEPAITKRGERVIAWVVGFNLVMLVLGPLAGATVVEALIALFRIG